ncbi:MAG: LAGLIDADG family homing endonuclease [Candidatus Micrarchaeota archaeon]
MAGFRLDYSKLLGLGFRIKDRQLVALLNEVKGEASCGHFISAHSLRISRNTLSSWLRCEYGIPIDEAVRIIGRERFYKLRVTRLYSGKAAGHCCATLPVAPSLPLMFLVGATIGDGSLRHAPGESYFISYEMADRSILKLIERAFSHVFLVSRKIKRIKRSDGRRSYLLKYSNKAIYYFFNRFFGLGPRKAHTVGLSEFDGLTRNQKLALLLGLFHTDGSLTKKYLRFYTSSRTMKNDLESALAGLGYCTSIYSYRRKQYSPEYQISVLGREKFHAELVAVETELIHLLI